MLGDSAICPGFGFASRYPSDQLKTVLEPVTPFLQGTITFGNLEVCLSDMGLDRTAWSSVQMRGWPHYAKDLRRAGFNCLSVANNHADQHGEEAFFHTVELLEAQGILVCGIAGTAGWACVPVVKEARHGRSVGILAYCLRPRQYGSGAAPFAQGTPDAILSDVGRLRRSADDVIVSLHWGEEFVDRPSEREVELGHALVEAGASLVIGHHPHVVRPVERVGSSVIAYSLGNFVTDMVWQERLRQGLILRCTLRPDGPQGVHTLATRVDDQFGPRPDGAWSAPPDETPVRGLPAVTYGRLVRKTVNAQRLRAYLYAVRNLWRYPPALAIQLAVVTVRNKLMQTLAFLRKQG